MRSIVFWALIGILLPVIFRRPFWGLALYSAFNIIRPEMLFWGGTTAAKSMIIVIWVTIIGMIFNSPNFSIKAIMRRELLLIMWLYIALIVSIALSQYDVPSAYYYANEIFKLFVLCLLVTVLIDSPEKVTKYEKILLLCIVLLGIWGIEQYLRGNVRLEGLGGQAFGGSNGVAAMFVLFAPVAIRDFLDARNIKARIRGLVITMIIVLLITFTESRGGFVGLLTVFLMIILKFEHRTRNILVLMLIVAMVFPFITDRYTGRLSTMQSEETLDYSAKSRVVLWKTGLMIFWDNPFFGSGFQSFPYEKMLYEEKFQDIEPGLREVTFNIKNPLVTHNTYIQVLSEAGLFAAIPYFLLIIGTFLKNRKIRRKYLVTANNKEMFALLSSIEAGIAGFCVCIFFINALGAVLLFVQIMVCSVIRDVISKNSIVPETAGT